MGSRSRASCEKHGRKTAPLCARPWIFQTLRFEQLQKALASRAFVPFAVAPDDFQQGVGGGVTIASRHFCGCKLEASFVIFRIGGDPLLKCARVRGRRSRGDV